MKSDCRRYGNDSKRAYSYPRQRVSQLNVQYRKREQNMRLVRILATEVEHQHGSCSDQRGKNSKKMRGRVKFLATYCFFLDARDWSDWSGGASMRCF